MSSNPHYSRRYKPWLFPFKARKPRNLARYPGSRKHPLQHLASCPLPLTPRPLSFLPCLSVAGTAMTTENSRQFEGGHSQHSGLLLPFWHWFWVLSGLRVHPPLLFQNCANLLWLLIWGPRSGYSLESSGCALLRFRATVHDSFSFVPRAIIARAFCCQSRVHQYLPIRRRVDWRLRNGEPSVWAFSWELFVQRRHRREIALERTDGVTSGTGEERPLRVEKWTLW